MKPGNRSSGMFTYKHVASAMVLIPTVDIHYPPKDEVESCMIARPPIRWTAAYLYIKACAPHKTNWEV